MLTRLRLAPAVSLVALLALLDGCSRSITVMSYNVHNLFDVEVDGTEYRDRQKPGAAEEAFRRQCSIIAGAIRAAVPGGPDLIAFQEIENEGVLRSLRDGWLRGMGYRFYVAAGGPPSATRVGFLSRLRIVGARSHLPAPAEEGMPQRAVLELELDAGGVRLFVLNNHWKSRLGGARSTEASRLGSAAAVADRVRRLLAVDPLAELIVLGDLNEDAGEPRDKGRRYALGLASLPEGEGAPIVLSTGTGSGAAASVALYDPWLEPASPRGSYAYGGVWSRPDHILLSAGLLDAAGLRVLEGSFAVAALPFLVESGNGFPRGGVDAGYPDHLPLVITLKLERAP